MCRFWHLTANRLLHFYFIKTNPKTISYYNYNFSSNTAHKWLKRAKICFNVSDSLLCLVLFKVLCWIYF